jgi:hypothetical protein
MAFSCDLVRTVGKRVNEAGYDYLCHNQKLVQKVLRYVSGL